MFFIVVGCGRVGSELACALFRKGHQVTVIDHVGSSFEHLDPSYRGRTIEAEALNHDVLLRAGIEQAQGLAAVTNSDPVNAVVARIARSVFEVPNVVARNYDPRYLPLHETMGLQSVSSTAWGAQRLEELLESAAAKAVFSAGNGEVEVYELSIGESWAGRALVELVGEGEGVAVALTRGGRAALPRADTRLAAGDVLHVSATAQGLRELRRRLTGEGA
ncbi:MAG: TrkA family potassium uptake protein [Vicinamibacteria bacterium]